MNRFVAYVLSALACVFMFGCAHPINMNPDLSALKTPAGVQVIDKQVGYHIPDSLRSLEVISPGGGGDKVRYFPYRDIEPGLYKALSEAFRGVSKVQDPKDIAALKNGNISLLMTPVVTTTSFSESLFTWPPTLFTVTLACTVSDIAGNTVQTMSVVGEGRATFDEFKGNLSLAAVRATNDALTKLLKAFSESAELRK
jgi:hypothetical protein